MELNNITVLTFATGRYVESQKKQREHLISLGVKKVIALGEDDLPEAFRQRRAEILKYNKGYGYWIWKPYLIQEYLKLLKDGEALLYIDTGDVPEKRFIDYVLSKMDSRSYLFFNRGYNNGQWTKEQCFINMNMADNNIYRDAVQLEAGVMCLTNKEIPLILEWYKYCCDYSNIIDQQPSDAPNPKCFIEHRHDQSVLTNLCIHYGYESVNLDNSYIKYNKNQ